MPFWKLRYFSLGNKKLLKSMIRARVRVGGLELA